MGNEREESEPAIKRRKFENERDESVAYAASEDNESATVIVPGINIPVVFDVKDEPRRKGRKHMPQANVGREESDLADDFVQTTPKKMPKLHQI